MAESTLKGFASLANPFRVWWDTGTSLSQGCQSSTLGWNLRTPSVLDSVYCRPFCCGLSRAMESA